jgi:hypothetical protein
MSKNNITHQEPNPDTRSDSDHTKSTSNPIDLSSSYALKTSSTDIRVHPRPVSSIDANSINIHSPASENSTPPVSTSPEMQQQPPVIQHPSNPAEEGPPDNFNIEVTSCSNSTARNTAPEHTLENTEPSDPVRLPDKHLDGKRRQYSNPLIKQLHDAVKAGNINEMFTAHSLTQWMSTFDIRKGDGTKYKNFKAGSFLSSSYIKKKNKTNRNSVCLDRHFNISKGVHEYWFVN